MNTARIWVMGDTAATRWAEALEEWAIPPEILARAPESPWGFPRGIFTHSAHQASAPGAEPTPTARRALEALPAGGSVLDVGVGGGATSLPLASRAGRITGVDQNRVLLEAFAASADRLGVAHTEVEGTWPDVAGAVEPTDVVVCGHVFYNVADLAPFVWALTAKARRRVVAELSVVHPQVHLNPLWRRFHGIDRPTGPGVDEALAVLAEAGMEPEVEHWEAPGRWESAPREELVAFARRRLCLPAERDPEVAAALDELAGPAPRHLATLWWPGGA